MIVRAGSWSCLLLVALWACQPADAQEWTRFRGPNGTGVSNAKTIPTRWTEEDYNWKVELPGIGHSSPVLWGDKIFLTSAYEDTATRIVLCLDAADGAVLWERRFESSPHRKHEFNSFASGTPAVDEERVYLVWSTPDEYTLMALDHEGHDVWNLNLGPFVGEHSSGTSPIVYEDLVVLGGDQGLSNEPNDHARSFLIAVDRRTGDHRWQIDRRTENVAYSTPCVYQPEGQSPLLIFNSGAHGITGVDPKSGKAQWEIDVLDKRSVSSPIVAAGLIFGTTGSGGGGHYLAAVRPAASPGGQPELAYRVPDAAPYVPTLIATDELVFLWHDKGRVTCIEAPTGNEVWQERVGGNFSGSPVLVDGRLYSIAENGTVVVLAADKKYQLLGRNPLGEDSRSTPAVAGGRMYLRTFSHLVSIGGK